MDFCRLPVCRIWPSILRLLVDDRHCQHRRVQSRDSRTVERRTRILTEELIITLADCKLVKQRPRRRQHLVTIELAVWWMVGQLFLQVVKRRRRFLRHMASKHEWIGAMGRANDKGELVVSDAPLQRVRGFKQ